MKRAPKAYKNLDFLRSRDARTLRILAEYIEPEKRFVEENINHTVVFFGSARIDENSDGLYNTKNYYWAAEEFAFKLAKYSKEMKANGKSFTICTGGGPGIMEASNRGAKRAKSKSIGLNISLPHEQAPNDYISRDLNFEFHYFFMRKLWFLYHAKAIIFFPGGYGTMDELFETLTLVQTKKMEKVRLPILLYDKNFWNQVINFKRLVDMKFISEEDAQLIHYFSSADEGMDYLKPKLKKSILEFTL